jgi:LemA protein
MSLLLILGIIAVIIVLLGLVYNSLIRAKVRTDEAWSDITVQLKRRYDLIPNLVNTVKGYASHEKTVLEDVTEARAQALNAQTVTEAAKADNQFQAALKSLFAVAENYPQLKANESFQQLQAELVDTEDKIQAARRFYNGAVRDLNIKIQSFPTNLFAGVLGFRKRDFFEVEGAENEAVSQPVKVDFNSTPESK